MNLPNYFLADLPAGASLSAPMITEACQTLKRNRERYLAGRSTRSLIKVISDVAACWLEPDYLFRRMALEAGPKETGFSRETIERGLGGFFRSLTAENLSSLIQQDLGDEMRLDQMISSDVEGKGNRASMTVAPELMAHIAAGNLPNPTLTSMVLGVLLRSAQFVKCASGAGLLPRLFAHSLYQVEPKLGACMEVVEWSGGNLELENALFAQADCVSATGSDQTLAAIRKSLPMTARFVGYGHRLSFAYVANGMLTGLNARKIIARAAADVTMWDQMGCLSPHVIYVENGGTMTPEQFAEGLAQELERHETEAPRGQLSPEEAANVASRRSIYELRSSANPDQTRQWSSTNSTAWTIVWETDPRFQISCLNRFVYVKGVANLTEALQSADGVRGKVSTVGLAATHDKAQSLATELAHWGVTRICPLGQMQNPPLTWRHDGRPALGELITWADWEME